MGLELLTARNVSDAHAAGDLSLPDSFDSTQFAAMWKLEGQAVSAATRREHVLGTHFSADGWTVWKNPDTQKPHKIPLSKGNFVLMCRPKEIQESVNALYGNVGKERMASDRAGHTVAGAAKSAEHTGILGDEDLKQVRGNEVLEEETGDVKMNAVPLAAGAQVNAKALVP